MGTPSTPSDPPDQLTVSAVVERVPQMLADLERLVMVESPSADLAAVRRGAEAVNELLTQRLGAPAHTVEIDGVTHLDWGDTSDPRVVLVCHQDTVWPLGTLDRIPFAVSEDQVTGPGSLDMLGGLVMGIHAIALCAGSAAAQRVRLLVTGDEEVGSLSSRQFILDRCAGARAALVLECAFGTDGAPKVGRKGVSMYTVRVRGRAAHAGLEPERGVNAGVELARLILQLVTLADPAAGTTVTPTTMSAGSSRNTVPAEAWVDLDVRATTAVEQDRVDHEIRRLATGHPDAVLTIDGGINRPPMELTHTEPLFARYRSVADRLGVAVPDGVSVGGASDGNFTAAQGIPTLDGIGAVGEGAHADHEHLLLDALGPRTAVLAGLIEELAAD